MTAPKGTLQMIAPPTASLSVVTGSGKQPLLTQDLPGNLDAFLTDFGNSIDVIANSSYAVFYVEVDASPVLNFNPITSQIAPANAPRHYKPPLKLGRRSKLRIYCEITAGAPSTPTIMSAQITIAAVTPGEIPNV
jgi:hypothetical protein